MARKTNKQLAEEREAWEAAREVERKATWMPRLMDILTRASKLQPDNINVVNSQFKVQFNKTEFTFGLESNRESENAFLDLEWEVEKEEMAEEEARRKAQLRSKALSKLTLEEREALGL